METLLMLLIMSFIIFMFMGYLTFTALYYIVRWFGFILFALFLNKLGYPFAAALSLIMQLIIYAKRI